MKTITLQLYTFDELSEEVQKEIIERERWNIMDQCMEAYGSDYVTSLRTFEKLTNTQSCSWSVNYSGYNFNFKYNNPIFECPIDCSNDIYADVIDDSADSCVSETFTETIYAISTLPVRYDGLFDFPTTVNDMIVSIFGLAKHLEIDLFWHIEQKMRYNELREKMHGKKY